MRKSSTAQGIRERVESIVAAARGPTQSFEGHTFHRVVADLVQTDLLADVGLKLLSCACQHADACEAGILTLIDAGVHSGLIDRAGSEKIAERRQEWRESLEGLLETAITLEPWDRLSRVADFSAFSPDDPSAGLYLAMKQGNDTALFIMAGECENDIDKVSLCNNKEALTPLEYAITWSSEDCAKTLLQFDPQLDLSSDGSIRPIERAVREGYWEVVEAMLERGVQPPVDPTALTYAPPSVRHLANEWRRANAAESASTSVRARPRVPRGL